MLKNRLDNLAQFNAKNPRGKAKMGDLKFVARVDEAADRKAVDLWDGLREEGASAKHVPLLKDFFKSSFFKEVGTMTHTYTSTHTHTHTHSRQYLHIHTLTPTHNTHTNAVRHAGFVDTCFLFSF